MFHIGVIFASPARPVGQFGLNLAFLFSCSVFTMPFDLLLFPSCFSCMKCSSSRRAMFLRSFLSLSEPFVFCIFYHFSRVPCFYWGSVLYCSCVRIFPLFGHRRALFSGIFGLDYCLPVRFIFRIFSCGFRLSFCLLTLSVFLAFAFFFFSSTVGLVFSTLSCVEYCPSERFVIGVFSCVSIGARYLSCVCPFFVEEK